MTKRVILLIVLFLILSIFAYLYQEKVDNAKAAEIIYGSLVETVGVGGAVGSDLVDLTSELENLDEAAESQEVVDLASSLEDKSVDSSELVDISGDLDFGDIDSEFADIESEILN